MKTNTTDTNLWRIHFAADGDTDNLFLNKQWKTQKLTSEWGRRGWPWMHHSQSRTRAGSNTGSPLHASA
jgi:hypothetical protein